MSMSQSDLHKVNFPETGIKKCVYGRFKHFEDRFFISEASGPNTDGPQGRARELKTKNIRTFSAASGNKTGDF